MRPFEDNYTSHSSATATATSAAAATATATTTATTTAKNNSFFSSLSDSIGSMSNTSYNATMAAPKLTNFFDCFSLSKTSDSGAFVDPPSAHLSSQTASSYLSATASELNSFQPSGSAVSSLNSASFKPFASYPYDLIQYPPFKNHLASSSSVSPPLAKKTKLTSTNHENNSVVKTDPTTGPARSKPNRSSNKNRTKSTVAKISEDRNKKVSVADETNTTPLNLSTNDVLAPNDIVVDNDKEITKPAGDIGKANCSAEQQENATSKSAVAEVN